jgi:hypothetical protein
MIKSGLAKSTNFSDPFNLSMLRALILVNHYIWVFYEFLYFACTSFA